MSDLHNAYLAGLRQLAESLGPEDQPLGDTLLHQLIENIDEAQDGNTELLRHNLSAILREANKLTRKTQGTSFLEFCGIKINSSDEFQPEELDEIRQNTTHDYIISACNYIASLYEAALNISILFTSEGDIWPKQCRESISALQQVQQPPLPENLPYSSLEAKLFFANERANKLTSLIDNFSPFSKDNSIKTRNLRLEIRQHLQDFPQHLRAAAEHINSVGALMIPPHTFSLPTSAKE